MTRTALLALHRFMRTRRRQPEAQLQEAVCKALRVMGTPGVLYHSVPNEGVCDARMMPRLKRMGLLPGVADLVIVVTGRAHYPELKAKGQKQSIEQIAFQCACEAQGTPYAVADNIDAALAVLRLWGALRAEAKAFRRAA